MLTFISKMNSSVFDQWTSFANQMDTMYKDHVVLFHDLLLLQTKKDCFTTLCSDESLVPLIYKLKDAGLLDDCKIERIKNLKFRVLALFAFPFWRCSKTLVTFAKDIKTTYLSAIEECDLPKSTKANLKTFADSMDAPINALAFADSFAQKEGSLPKVHVRELIKTLPTVLQIPTYKHVIKGDISEMALNSDLKGTMFDIFTSIECPGGGVFSLTTHGGQEEATHYKHFDLCLYSLFVVGKPNLSEQVCGKATWLSDYNPTKQLIYFQYSSVNEQWFQYHASLKRTSNMPPTEEEEVEDFRRSLISSELLCKDLGLNFVTGERGCGIYGGNIKRLVIAACDLTERTTVCVWNEQAWNL